MALKVVNMAELRQHVILEPEQTGDSVAEVCRRHGISRETFYEYRRRYLAEGIDGLEPRSRQPYHSPARIDIDLEVKICKMRKDHRRWGARTIRTELLRSGVDAPAESTIHQVLRRNHLVADQPKKRPKFNKRFERETPNDLWQIDATQLKLENRGKAWAMNTLDDQGRQTTGLRDAQLYELLRQDHGSMWNAEVGAKTPLKRVEPFYCEGP